MAQDTKFIKTSTNNLFIKIPYVKRRGNTSFKISIFIDKLKLSYSSMPE